MHVVFESAEMTARSLARAVPTRDAALALARETAARSGRPAFACRGRGRTATFEHVDAIHPDGTVEEIVKPEPEGPPGWVMLREPRSMHGAETEYPSLAATELRAYVAECEREERLEVLRAHLQRHLQDDADLVDHLLRWVD